MFFCNDSKGTSASKLEDDSYKSEILSIATELKLLKFQVNIVEVKTDPLKNVLSYVSKNSS